MTSQFRLADAEIRIHSGVVVAICAVRLKMHVVQEKLHGRTIKGDSDSVILSICHDRWQLC